MRVVSKLGIPPKWWKRTKKCWRKGGTPYCSTNPDQLFFFSSSAARFSSSSLIGSTVSCVEVVEWTSGRHDSRRSLNIKLLKKKRKMRKWGFPETGAPQIIHFRRIFPYKPSNVGYPHFRKPNGIIDHPGPFWIIRKHTVQSYQSSLNPHHTANSWVAYCSKATPQHAHR